jgi:hypothetical protein
MSQNNFDEIFWRLLLIHHTVQTWHRPTSGFSDHVKTSLPGRAFNDVGELREAVIEFPNEIHPSELQLVFTTGSNN